MDHLITLTLSFSRTTVVAFLCGILIGIAFVVVCCVARRRLPAALYLTLGSAVVTIRPQETITIGGPGSTLATDSLPANVVVLTLTWSGHHPNRMTLQPARGTVIFRNTVIQTRTRYRPGEQVWIRYEEANIYLQILRRFSPQEPAPDAG